MFVYTIYEIKKNRNNNKKRNENLLNSQEIKKKINVYYLATLLGGAHLPNPAFRSVPAAL